MVMVFCPQFALGNRVCPTSISILRLLCCLLPAGDMARRSNGFML